MKKISNQIKSTIIIEIISLLGKYLILPHSKCLSLVGVIVIDLLPFSSTFSHFALQLALLKWMELLKPLLLYCEHSVKLPQ